MTMKFSVIQIFPADAVSCIDRRVLQKYLAKEYYL